MDMKNPYKIMGEPYSVKQIMKYDVGILEVIKRDKEWRTLFNMLMMCQMLTISIQSFQLCMFHPSIIIIVILSLLKSLSSWCSNVYIII